MEVLYLLHGMKNTNPAYYEMTRWPNINSCRYQETVGAADWCGHCGHRTHADRITSWTGEKNYCLCIGAVAKRAHPGRTGTEIESLEQKLELYFHERLNFNCSLYLMHVIYIGLFLLTHLLWWFVSTDGRLTLAYCLYNTDMYLMFDVVWNGEYNEYTVESRIIGEETLYSIQYTYWKVLVCPFYKEKALSLSVVLSVPI